MIIGGLQKTSLVDWPEKICSVVFIAGCNFRCGFCHNPELVLPEEIEMIESLSENDLFTALVERRRFIDGVCITGGEPLLSPDVIKLIRKLKDKGFDIKLDTNGTVPTLLQKLIDDKLVDYVAMDIKVPKSRYQEITETNVNTELIEQSIKILKQSNINYEFRTTVVKGLHTKADIVAIGAWLKGADAYYLQQFNSREKMVDGSYVGRKAFAPEQLHEMMQAVADNFEKTGVRGI